LSAHTSVSREFKHKQTHAIFIVQAFAEKIPQSCIIPFKTMVQKMLFPKTFADPLVEIAIISQPLEGI
jgi:hypothetical protein